MLDCASKESYGGGFSCGRRVCGQNCRGHTHTHIHVQLSWVPRCPASTHAPPGSWQGMQTPSRVATQVVSCSSGLSHLSQSGSSVISPSRTRVFRETPKCFIVAYLEKALCQKLWWGKFYLPGNQGMRCIDPSQTLRDGDLNCSYHPCPLLPPKSCPQGALTTPQVTKCKVHTERRHGQLS